MKDKGKTNVAIPNDSYELLKRLKRETDIPLAALVKRAILLLNEKHKQQLQ